MAIEGTIEPLLGDIDYGRWSGRSFEDVHVGEPDAFAAWLGDATGACPGGEPMTSVMERVGTWLDRATEGDGPVCGITHPTVIRAALAHALAMPLRTTLAIDVAPLSRVKLSHSRQWRLQSLGPIG